MNVPFVNPRYVAITTFEQIRTNAVLASFFSKVLGRNTRLKILTHQIKNCPTGKNCLGVIPVPISQIKGSVMQRTDFDESFRPLCRSLKEPWIRNLLSLDKDGWAPIKAIRIGSEYYIDEGHTQASVARCLGLEYIDAEVWDIQPQECRRPACCLEFTFRHAAGEKRIYGNP